MDHWWIVPVQQPSPQLMERNTGECKAQHRDTHHVGGVWWTYCQHYALWQATAFRLPLAQQEASSWWDAPPALQGLHLQNFHPHTSDPWNFSVVHQEKTLAIARVLQACAEASRVKSGVLCGAVRKFQLCMVLLMTINGDDVMETSLLGLVEEAPGPSPTLEEESALLGEGARTAGAPGPASQQVKSARYVELAEQTTAPVTSITAHCHPSLKKRIILGRDWHWSQQYQHVGKHLFKEG